MSASAKHVNVVIKESWPTGAEDMRVESDSASVSLELFSVVLCGISTDKFLWWTMQIVKAHTTIIS